MQGRNPHEEGRAATPLELLYDLTLVVAFAVAGSEAAHLVSEGLLVQATLAFSFAFFGAVWAWINYGWFSSAFDTDDWYVRVCVLVQMVGVIVMALGMPQFFAGIAEGWHFHNQVMVLGYILMRLGLVPLWLRGPIWSPC